MAMFVDRRSQKMAVWAFVAVFSVVALSGCTTLRRKFIRKSKTEDSKDRIVPVLQPEDYKPAVLSSLDKYRTHYVMLKGYFGDLWDVLGRGEGEKRERYILSQIAVKIDAMADLLKEDKQAELKKLSAKVFESMKELDKAHAMRRYDIMSSDLKAVESGVRRGFKPDLVEQFFK